VIRPSFLRRLCRAAVIFPWSFRVLDSNFQKLDVGTGEIKQRLIPEDVFRVKEC
jgi:hypothetical protein